MRGVRSTLALVVIFLGLAGYVYVLRSRKPASPAANEPKVFSVRADKIDGLTVRATSGESSTLKQVDGKWRLVQPQDAAADESEVDDITTSLSSLTVARVIARNPSDLTPFGLATPRMEIGFQAAGDPTPHRLLIGDKNATGIDLYAKRQGAREVFLIPAYLQTTFNLTPFQLRDKTLLTFDRDKVNTIDVTTPEHAVELTKTGTTSWMMQTPLHAPGDYLAAENLLGRLQTAKMKSIVTETATPADLKKDGLDKPAVTVRLTAGSATTTLELGAKSPDGTVYARDLSRPRIVTVEASLLDDLRKDPADFRQKDLFAFRSYNADWISIRRNGRTVTFQQVKGRGKNAAPQWHRLSPAGTVKDADMEDFLSKLSGLRASSWIASTAHTGLDKPYATVSVKFEHDRKQETVTFGRQGSNVYAERADQPGAATLGVSAFDDAMKALDVVAK